MAKASLSRRVATAMEELTKGKEAVSPLAVMMRIGWLSDSHLKGWMRGMAPALEPLMASTRPKQRRVLELVDEWARERGLEVVTGSYLPSSVQASGELQVTEDGDARVEAAYRRHYLPGHLSERQRVKAAEKTKEAPELMVVMVSTVAVCSGCEGAIHKHAMMVLEKGAPLCLDCADLGHLIYLPAGDATLTRRSKKYSRLHAVVIEWNKRMHRYLRRGLLVEESALEKAEEECLADADLRAVRRERAAGRREQEDDAVREAIAQSIREQFPHCPAETVAQIAAHTSRRGSGCVGRSEAGRSGDPRAVQLAVIAHIRHTETQYDLLLMQGCDRDMARLEIRADIDEVLDRWR